MLQTREQRAVERQRAYEAFEYDRMRTDEITDASERLPLPMRNQFDYELSLDDGHLYFQGQRLDDVFDTGVRVAEALVSSRPQFMVELLRRRLERQEYACMRELALRSDDRADLLVVLSPIPDAVASGTVDLGAYDKGRMRTMLRVFRRTDSGIAAASVSLDLSDREGIQAIAARFGVSISPDASSEDILGTRLWGYSSEFSDDYVSDIARLYDDVLERRYGGAWSGGRQGEHMLDAQGFISAQEDLLSDHMARMWLLLKQGADDHEKAEARYDFAAALARRLRGDGDAASLEAAGSEARANNEQYENDCPTGPAQAASESLERLGLARREWKRGSCVNCHDMFNPGRIVGECNVCRHCENADNNGMMQAVAKQATALQHRLKNSERAAQSAPVSEKKTVNKQPPAITRQFGEKAVLRSVLMIGGKDNVVFNRETNEVIAKL